MLWNDAGGSSKVVKQTTAAGIEFSIESQLRDAYNKLDGQSGRLHMLRLFQMGEGQGPLVA